LHSKSRVHDDYTHAEGSNVVGLKSALTTQ